MSRSFFLRSVAIENFKAVRRSGTVKLTPLTVFIGNNGSGKSSLIEALETYRAIVLDGLDDAMHQWRGMEHVRNKRASRRRRRTSAGHETYQNPLIFRLNGRLKLGNFNVALDAGLEAGGNLYR